VLGVLAALPALHHLLTGATGTTRTQLREKAQVLLDFGPAAHADLRTTLFAFARADMNVTRAARDLLIHENTLRYRLRRIRERSAHNPQTFAGLVELICLIEVLELEP
jgi:sugar diacid utilization regulator